MSSTASTATNIHLNRISLPIARSVFFILSLGKSVFFGMVIPLYYARLIQLLDTEALTALRELGICHAFYAIYQTSLVVLLAIGFGGEFIEALGK